MEQYLQLIELSEAGRWLTIGWCFVLGSCIGSFLNVVAYRLPRGLSLSRPASSCPNCHKFIRWHDNVPILGWLRLRGRCRDCHVPISSRYPIVEFLVASASALLAATSIQRLTLATPAGFTYEVLPIVLGFRLLVLYVLATGALLEFDHSLPPVRLVAGAAIVMLALGLLVPELLSGNGSDAGLWGAATALLQGALVWPLLVGEANYQGRRSATCGVLGLLLIGAAFGWQGVCGVGLLAALGTVLARFGSRIWPALARVGWASWLIAGTLVWLTLAPRVLPNCEPRPLGVVFVTGMLVAALALLGRAASGQTQRSLLPGG